jgi:predicted nucleic acid-binding protein
LGFGDHLFHEPVAQWVHALVSRGEDALATCAITELGFVRVLAQAPQYGFTIEDTRTLLLHLKSEGSAIFSFLADDREVSHLPKWVKVPKQITDGQLIRLAKANGAMLATLDRKIPTAFQIPHKLP